MPPARHCCTRPDTAAPETGTEMSLAKGKGKNTQDKLYKVQVAPVSALEAAEGRTRVSEGIQTGLKARQLASQTHLTALILSPTQKQALNVLYTGSTAIQEHHFHAPGPEAHASQVEAFVLMAVHGLDVDSREEPGNRWSVRATQLSTTAVGHGQTRRYLLQWCIRVPIKYLVVAIETCRSRSSGNIDGYWRERTQDHCTDSSAA